MNAGPAWMQADWGNLIMVSWLVDAALVQEMQRIAGRGAERRARHQALIDERD